MVHFVLYISTGPTIKTLYNLQTCKGNINIIERSAKHYKVLGAILLGDDYGYQVDILELDNKKVEGIMRGIYQKWLDKDDNCTWVSLTECFRSCGLCSLACSIEQHFGLCSSEDDSKGRCDMTHTVHIDCVLNL